MDDLISALLQVDKQARQRVAKAKKQRAGALEELENAKKEIRAKNEESFDRFVGEQTLSINTRRDEQIRNIDLQYDGVDEALDETRRANEAAWISAIVSDVTSA